MLIITTIQSSHTGKHEICTVSATNEPMCSCKLGYRRHEEYGCVDVNPPTLKLRHDPQGDKTLRLKQGDEYREFMVDIVDDNAEDYLRSLKVTYSRPLPPGCLTSIGEFHVNYTVAMPWATPPYVRVTRRVVIEDIDECSLDVAKYQRLCPELVVQCDTAAGAKCLNTVGSYACQCPRNTSGDGFIKTAKFSDIYPAPPSFNGGTSCVDTTKPVISLQGPNPKVFKICACGGLDGFMTSTKDNDEDKNLQAAQRKLYEADIREMIEETAGAELCATYDHPRRSPSDCITAVDHTHSGDVDLSDQVLVGAPVQISSLHWVVPYNVKDAAGNEAATVNRDIIVEEVDLKTIEKKIRDEVIKEERQRTERSFDAVLREERKKWEQENRESIQGRRSVGMAAKTCPACPPCDCPDMAQADAKSCANYCDDVSVRCMISDDNVVHSLLLWLIDLFPIQVIATILLVCFLGGIFFAWKFLNFLFSPRAYSTYDYRDNNGINDDIVFLLPPDQRQEQRQRSHSHMPPSSSMNGASSGLFSPSQQKQEQFSGSPPSNSSHIGYSTGDMNQIRPSMDPSLGHENGTRIYQSPGLITPSKNGEGARTRRSPYR
jgi:hypothetical protein